MKIASILAKKRGDKAGKAGSLPQESAIKLLGKGGKQPASRWRGYIWIVLSAYRLIAFAIATTVIFAFPSAFHSVIPPLILVISLGIYSLLKTLQPLRWYQEDILGFSALGIDIAVCVFLIVSTGGFYSPFLLYTLAPVLTAAIFLDRKVAFSVAGLSIAYVVAGHLYNPFSPTPFSLNELSSLLVYLVAVCLAAALPYLTNVNLRQRLQLQDIVQERQRLSREIHDGIAQTLSALRWQAQLLHHHLADMGIDLDDARQLEELAETAHQDTRESLELLRNYTSDGNFPLHLQEYLEHLKQQSKINFQLDIATGELTMDSLVEIELLRICQEALTNIRRHSRAHNVSVKLRPVNHHLELSIADDGCGFDAIAYQCDGRPTKGHGLAVMKERADSIGGRLSVSSLPGKGTEVQVKVPLTPHRGRLWRRR
jgi:signal transduction histidine kinase